jgi:LPXTG-motif cell wall-anchored protein
VKNLTTEDNGTVTLYAQWMVVPVLTSSDADAEIYVGGRIVLTPNIEGGEWNWDEAYFSATFNSPATFTALKAGTSTITYTVDGVHVTYEVTIERCEIPDTGQNFTWPWLTAAGAIMIFAVALTLTFRKRAARG